MTSFPFCYIAVRYLHFACLMVALPAGTCFALVLQNAVIYMINYQYSVYIFIGGFCLVFSVLCLMFDDHAISYANAITASYVIMRCIGLFLDYPYEFVVYYEKNLYRTENFVRILPPHHLYSSTHTCTYTQEDSRWASY